MPSASFSIAMDFLLKNEGGFSNDPDDRGGATAYGITANFLMNSNLWRYDVNGDGIIDADDMRHFTKMDAIDVYRRYWWDQYHYGLFSNNDIAKRVFDFAVNAGQSRAIKTLQECLNVYAPDSYSLLKVDGILGNATTAKTNEIALSDKLPKLLKCYADERYNYYQNLIAKNPALKKFERGWNKRAYL